MSQKFFLTTAIPYINAAPHIGFALELIQADVIARYQRLLGKEVFFLTGTDEHGLKNQQTAEKLSLTPQEMADKHSARFQELTKALNISNDFFLRTTDSQKHWPNVRKIWELLAASGDIYKGSYTGKYCVGCEAFLTEKDLENGLCKYHHKPPEEVTEENYFFKLSRFQGQLKTLIETDELKIYPEWRKQEVLTFLESGLEDKSFSRPKEKLSWGIPVPGDESQVIYVWADALTNYLSGVDFAEAGAKFQRFWPPDLQMMGKDIWIFHAIIWPAMLLSANLPLPKQLFIHGFINVGGVKMSKSLGNVIEPFSLVQEYGGDAVRYYFLREVSPFDDGDYTEEKFKNRYNADLANGIGNLVSRVAKLVELAKSEIVLQENFFNEKVTQTWQQYTGLLEQFKFNESLALINALVSEGDAYLNENKPWELLKNEDAESLVKFNQVVSSLVLLLGNVAWLLTPFVPATSEKILLTFGLAGDKEGWQNKPLRLNALPALFPRK